MRAFRGFLVALVPFLAACPRSSSSSGAAPTPSASGSFSASSADSAAPIAADASTTFDAGLPDDEFIGAIGGHPIHATLTLTPTSIEGRWFYEAHGAASGLGVDCKSKTSPMQTCDGNEVGDKNAVTGKIHLEKSGASFVGSWTKPDGSGQLGVRLTPVVRSRGADHVILARRIMKKSSPSPESGALFFPAVDGPAAARVAPGLTLKPFIDEDEKDLTGDDGVTALDFDVVRDDEHFLTVSVVEETMGAYPDSHVETASFDWATGKRIGASAFLPEKKAAIVKLLNDRVHAAWRAQKAALSKKNDPNECGKDIADNFMDGDGPPFTTKDLGFVFVTKTGIDFPFDYAFPHVARACAPDVDLSLRAADAKPFVDPKASLGNL